MVILNKITNLNGFKKTELGMIPEDWEIKPLGNEFIEFKNGLWKGKKEPFIKVKVLRNTNFRSDGFLNFDNIAELYVEQRQFSTREIVKGDIIVERSGGGPTQPVGRVVYFDRENKFKYSFSNFTTRIRVINKDKVFSKYLFYFLLEFYLSGKTNDIQNRTTGIRNLDFSKYKQVPVIFPSLPEQQKIAAVLSAVQEAKEKTEQVINATKELKKSMMKYLFTYGPVPLGETENVTLKETELGPLPEEWEVVTLKSHLLLNESGVWGDAPSEGEIGIEVFRSTNIQNSNWVFGDVARRHLTEKQLRRYQLKEGDILITKSSGSKKHIGKAAYVNDSIEDRKVAFSNFMQRIQFGNYILPKFSFFYITSDRGRKALLRRSTTTTGLRNLTKTDIESLLIPLPPLYEQRKIASILSAIDEKIQAEENKKNALDELFKSMLHNLMTAKIRVNNLEV